MAEIDDAGEIQGLAATIIRLRQRANDVQAAGGVFTPASDPDISIPVTASITKAQFTDKITAAWARIKVLAAGH